MTRKSAPAGRKPVTPKGLRQRQRADGSLRVWWEPRAEDRKLGFAAVELDGNRMTWSRSEATKLNAQVEEARSKGGRIKPRRGGRTIDDLIADYRASAHFKATLRPKTRTSYHVLLLQIASKWGTDQVAAFDKPTMMAWYQTLFTTGGRRRAQALIRMMSVLLGHAEELGWRPGNSNPCHRLKIASPADRERVATVAELAAVMAGAEALGFHGMALAIRLALFQGQRQTDIRVARRSEFTLATDQTGQRRWVWSLIRSKRQTAGMIPLHPEVLPHLRAALVATGPDGAPRRPEDPLIYDERTGNPYTERLFVGRWWQIIAWAADEKGGNCPSASTLQFRDLRRTFGVLARAGGAEKGDVGDVLGNSAAVNPRLAGIYMPASFETIGRAVAAVRLPQQAERKKA